MEDAAIHTTSLIIKGPSRWYTHSKSAKRSIYRQYVLHAHGSRYNLFMTLNLFICKVIRPTIDPKKCWLAQSTSVNTEKPQQIEIPKI